MLKRSGLKKIGKDIGEDMRKKVIRFRKRDYDGDPPVVIGSDIEERCQRFMDRIAKEQGEGVRKVIRPILKKRDEEG